MAKSPEVRTDRRSQRRSLFLKRFVNRVFGTRLDRVLVKIASFLPKPLFYKAIRHMYKPRIDLPDNMIIKIAETVDEIRQAFEIQYDQYVHMRYTEENAAKIICNHYHSLPHSHIVVVKLEDEVVATMTVFGDSSLGLPLESGWDIKRDEIVGKRIGELGSLCIKRGRPGLKGRVFFPLAIYGIRYAKSFLNMDRVFIATRSNVKEFYSALYGFRKLQKKDINYGTVKGFLSTAQYVDLEEGYQRLYKTYKGFKRENHLGHILNSNVYPSFKFPVKKYSSIRGSQLKKEDLEYFFVSKLPVFENMNLDDLLKITNELGAEAREALPISISEFLAAVNKQPRGGNRFPVSFSSIMRKRDGGRFFEAQFFDVSRSGARIKTSVKLEVGEVYFTSLRLEGSEPVQLEFEVGWVNDHFTGVKLLKTSNTFWTEMLDFFTGEITAIDQEKEKLAA